MADPITSPPFVLHRVTALIGPFGAGKSELSIGLSLFAAQQARANGAPLRRAVLGDLDVLKPYFRAREMGMRLEREGVSVVAPEGALANSDLPLIAPELRGFVRRRDVQVILDVGGDPVGARALGSLSDVIADTDHELLLVLNRYRPFMDDLEQVVELARQLELAARLRIGGIVSNTNLLDETTAEDVHWGLDLARAVGERLGIPVRLLAVPHALSPQFTGPGLPPVVAIRRQMLPFFLGGVVLAPPPVSHASMERS